MNRRSVLEFSPGAAGPLLRLADARELDWQDRALCAEVDGDLFFPEQGGSARQAKRVCRACEVRVSCLEFALENEEPHGVWGGLSPEERSALLRDRRQAREAVRAGLKAVLDERARQRHPDGTKRCSRCGDAKPLAAFSHHRGNPDGLAYQCLDCRALERATLGEAA